MKTSDYARLTALAAIWGASFLFMRIASPAVGPWLTAQSRLLVAGVVLSVAYAALGAGLGWRRHWRGFLAIGFFNAGLPFLLFAWAAQTLSASLSAILNATVPLFGALIAACTGGETMNRRRALGLAVGFAGVVIVSGYDPRGTPPGTALAILACLGAAASYGIAAVNFGRWSGNAAPRSVAAGSLLAAGLMLTPGLAVTGFPPADAFTPGTLGALAALALLCSALAYVLYFRLIHDIGPTRTLIVTYLIPVFGVLWGVSFLDEALPAGALGGGVLVLIGTLLVTRH